MGVYIRRDSPYFWILLEPTGKKYSSKIPVAAPDAESRKRQRESAEAVYRARMTDLARKAAGLPELDPLTITFDRFADWYDTHHIAKHRGQDREREILRWLREHFGAMLLTDITAATVSEYETARLRATPRAPGARTVNREVALLKAMLNAAVPTYLPASPLKGRKLLRAVKRKKRIIRSAAEEARLLAELAPVDQALYIVAVDTLMRMSNVLNLRRDEDKGTYLELTDSKTGPYTVPLSTRARKALDSLPGSGVYYFAHRRSAKTDRDRRAAIRQMLQRACKRAGIPFGKGESGITFHSATRATGATRMLRAGVDLRTVQGVGNWSDLRAMQEYLHTDDAAKRRAVEKAAPAIDVDQTMADAAETGKARRIAQARKAGKARQAKAQITRRLRAKSKRGRKA